MKNGKGLRNCEIGIYVSERLPLVFRWLVCRERLLEVDIVEL
jgi:hypothetical protein